MSEAPASSVRQRKPSTAGAYTVPLYSSTKKPVLVSHPRDPLSNTLGGKHAPNVSQELCLR